MSPGSRARSALLAALPIGVEVLERSVDDADAVVTVVGSDLLLRWLNVGWPRQVAEALSKPPRPDVLVAPLLSPGARKAASDAGVGWVDESGAAAIVLPGLVVAKDGRPQKPLDTKLGWRPATLAVCEALLAGEARPTVSSVVEATGLSMKTAATSLKFLEGDGYLVGDAARGRDAARRIVDPDTLLDAYADAASRLRSPKAIQVGVLWRDPVAGAIDLGSRWTACHIAWAATSALSASVLAPVQTEIAPIEIYVSARAPSDLRRAAAAAGLREIAGGRLLLRPFPTPAGDAVTAVLTKGFRSAFWPRVYADLRTAGVRGEDAAEHLRETIRK